MRIITYIIIANTLLTAVWLFLKGIPKKCAGMAPLFLFLPIIGFIMYIIPPIAEKFTKTTGVDREGVLTHITQIELPPERPDVRWELNIVPTEDAVAVGSASEKRELLMRELAKDMETNCRLMLAAAKDKDSESVHYIASAKTELMKKWQTRWTECRKEYEQNPNNEKTYHAACTVLMQILDYGLFSKPEQNMYRIKLCKLVETQLKTRPGSVLPEERCGVLKALTCLGRYNDAIRVWEKYPHKEKDEDAYRAALKLYYLMGDAENMRNTLRELRGNFEIWLPAEDKEQTAYWKKRLSRTDTERMIVKP